LQLAPNGLDLVPNGEGPRARARGAEDSYDLLTSRSFSNLSLYTVETHRRNLQEKLNLHSVAELILYAVRKGVISQRAPV
jgi:hypothetical protein